MSWPTKLEREAGRVPVVSPSRLPGALPVTPKPSKGKQMAALLRKR